MAVEDMYAQEKND